MAGPDVHATDAATDETPVRDYACAALGLLVTGAFAAVFYPLLLALTEPFAYLNTTMVVSMVILFWIVSWTCIESAWEWRLGRRDGT